MEKIDWNSGWSFYPVDRRECLRTVTLPHDAMLEENRDSANPSDSAGAYFAGGIYHYEKRFSVKPEWKSKELHLLFEGIYQTADILINGQLAAQVKYGYAETEVNITPYLCLDGENVVEVLADNSKQPNSRWYSGAGIYRPVNLWVLEPDGLVLDGIQVKTISIQPAIVQVDTRHNRGCAKVEIIKDGRLVASGSGSKAVIEIPDAQLWSAEHPEIYQCQVVLEENNAEFDRQTVNFGIRTLSWSSKGFLVNGQETLFQGGCIHHDNGILGACAYDEAEWRKVRILRENGFNALRISHNPSSRAMLDACDQLGMYVMDETWDMWFRHKSKYDYAEHFDGCWQDDVKQLVRRDYNHPSVVMYSIGNEVSEPVSEKGQELEHKIVELVHQLDDSRAVTGGFNLTILYNASKGMLMYNEEGGVNQDAANNMSGDSHEEEKTGMPQEMNSTIFNQLIQQVGIGMNHATDSEDADKAISPALDLLDIAGYNYASGRYPLEEQAHPSRVILGSETFPQEIYHNWQMVKRYPYLVGDFMWTAWDYLGEAGLGCWTCRPDAMNFNKPYPFLLGGAGVISILGDADGEALYANIVWNENASPRIAVRPLNQPEEKLIKSVWRGTNAIPAWSWRDYEGHKAVVEVYGRGVEAELLLNGNSIARQPMTEYRAMFDTVYQSGTLTAVVYDENGSEVGRDTLSSAVGCIKPVIHCESQPVSGKLLYVNIDLCGDNGIVERAQDRKLSVQVTGGELLGYGSGCPCTEESYLTGTYTTWQGRSQAVIRVGNAESLTITVFDGTERTVQTVLVAEH